MSVSATADQCLGIRRRDGLAAEPVYFRGRKFWNIKDPLALRFYQFRDEEYFVLSQLDGEISLSELQRRFNDRFAPERIDLRQLHGFLGVLHREALVTSSAPDQGQRLWERRNRLRADKRWQSVSNLLALRFRGVNPEPVLAAIYPLVRWLYSPVAVLAGGSLILFAFCWALLNFERLALRLPAYGDFLHPGNLVWLALVLAGIKMIHELAHGLTCKHFGGTCRELGVMLLVFTPCLYCNVSDAWLLRGKWQRIAVSGAGIYAELVLASIALFVWQASGPGLLNSIALNVVAICSVGTVLFNGNPLLRYDGYYILADLLEVPNLGEQAAAATRNSLASLLGVEGDESPLATDMHRAVLILYGVMACCYRLALVAAILYGVYHLLAAQRAQLLALPLIAVVVLGMLVPTLRRTAPRLVDPSRKRPRPTFAALLVSMLAAGLIWTSFLPFPQRVTLPAIMRVRDTVVYAPVSGHLKSARAAGQFVRQGEVIAELEDPELAARIVETSGQRDVQRLRVATLEQQAVRDVRAGVTGASSLIPAARERLADLEAQLDHLVADQERLEVRAPCDGFIIPARDSREPPTDELLAYWSGTPLDDCNRGCFLERGTPLCSVGDSENREARVFVGENQVGQVRAGQAARLWSRSAGATFIDGRVTLVAGEPVKDIPPELAESNLIAHKRVADRYEPLTPLYEVRVTLDAGKTRLPTRLLGKLQITASPRSFVERWRSYFRQSFAHAG